MTLDGHLSVSTGLVTVMISRVFEVSRGFDSVEIVQSLDQLWFVSTQKSKGQNKGDFEHSCRISEIYETTEAFLLQYYGHLLKTWPVVYVNDQKS